jgi:hypothetical protein
VTRQNAVGRDVSKQATDGGRLVAGPAATYGGNPELELWVRLCKCDKFVNMELDEL